MGKMAGRGRMGEPPVEIALVGVVHGDPEGYTKAMALLEQWQPRAVSVEISAYSWQYRRRWTRRWQAQFQAVVADWPPEQRHHLALQRVQAQIAMPFEVRATVTYTQRHGLGWQPIDSSSLAREHLPLYSRELLTPGNLRQLLTTADGDFPALIRQEYARAASYLWDRRPGPQQPIIPVDPRNTLREKVMAHRLRRLARRWTRILHLGGWEHLIYTGQNLTLADFLAPYRPQRLLLAEGGVGRIR